MLHLRSPKLRAILRENLPQNLLPVHLACHSPTLGGRRPRMKTCLQSQHYNNMALQVVESAPGSSRKEGENGNALGRHQGLLFQSQRNSRTTESGYETSTKRELVQPVTQSDTKPLTPMADKLKVKHSGSVQTCSSGKQPLVRSYEPRIH